MNNLVSGQFGGGAGADSFGGNISVGAEGVSFWGGGNDTFNFAAISGFGDMTNTAYFWNEAGTDQIILKWCFWIRSSW